MDTVLEQVRQILKDSVDERTLSLTNHFFKEGERAKTYGVKMAFVSKIGKEFFQEIKNLPKAEIFGLCEELWQSGYLEEAVIACESAYSLRKQYESKDFETFERW